MRHGGQILVDQLKLNGVERVFSVPGESYLAVLDGLYDSGIVNVVCRHEGGAAMMAEATAKLTGRPGVAFVTRGPGATNASSGVHVAQQDSTPMVLFVGQIARVDRDRDAFQEVDYRAMFGGLAKWVAEIDDTARIPEYVNRAFHLAVSGRPGPVVLALPEDMLAARAELPPLPPAMTSGRSAASSSRRTSRSAAGAGKACAGSMRGSTGAAVAVVSMSSGSASTTGPGRPCSAMWKARATYSGSRSADCTSPTHFAKPPLLGPNTAR
jgi:acetolactate synthase-1/2/3 large subunit